MNTKLELRWNNRKVGYQSNLSLKDTINQFNGFIECVYPSDEESYYVYRGGNYDLSIVYCKDGEFFGDTEVCRSLCVSDYVRTIYLDDDIETWE